MGIWNKRSIAPIILVAILLASPFQSIISNNSETIFDECEIFDEETCTKNNVLVITLDDQSHLNSWWNNRPLFLENELVLTMFIDRTSRLNETEWSWLAQFQNDGHEIGLHGANHSGITAHLDAGGDYDSYIEIEVLPELEEFENHGIYPTAFAYPHGHRTLESDEKLLQHFHILRATDRWNGNDDIPETEKYNQRIVKGYSTDREYNSIDGIIMRMDNNEDIVTYGHRLDPAENPYHSTNPGDLIKLANEAKSRGYKLQTISQLAQPDHKKGLEIMYHFMDTGSIDTADRILENCWNLPRFEETCFEGEVPAWNENPFDENYWIFVFYSLRPLRHLLYAWQQTGNIEYRDHLIKIIDSFSENAEDSEYVYDTVADKHGAAFRAMVLINIKWKLSHELLISDAEENMIDNLIEDTTVYLVAETNFQKNNNHGYTQAAALWMVVANQDNLENRDWIYQLAIERLQYMMESIIGEDGVMIENSPYYHLYILNKVGEIDRWGKKNGVMLPAIMEDRVPLMVDYAIRSTHPDGHVPLLGAAIPGDGLTFHDWINFEAEYPELAWARSDGERGVMPLMLESYYPSAGQILWRSSWNESLDDTAHLLFDVGPYRTDHSDLDALTLTWWTGRPIIIDSGLYSYEMSSIRDYFHGTSAHNTLVVDGLDQTEGTTLGVINPTFGENLPYHLSFSAHELNEVWIGRIVLAIGNHTLIVIDQANGEDAHDFELNWHFANDLTFQQHNGSYQLLDGQDRFAFVDFISNQELNHNIWNGSTEPFRGWTIDGYEQLIATNNWEIDSNYSVNQLQMISVFSLTDEPPELDLIKDDPNNLSLSIKTSEGSWILNSTGTLDYTGLNPEDVELTVS